MCLCVFVCTRARMEERRGQLNSAYPSRAVNPFIVYYRPFSKTPLWIAIQYNIAFQSYRHSLSWHYLASWCRILTLGRTGARSCARTCRHVYVFVDNAQHPLTLTVPSSRDGADNLYGLRLSTQDGSAKCRRVISDTELWWKKRHSSQALASWTSQ